MTGSWILLAYVVASVMFIVGLQRLSSPRTAPSGNLIAGAGMLVAIVATLLDRSILSYGGIITGVVLGSAFGAVAAYRVKMTAMPQMVALFNGFGGAASALVAGAELVRYAGIEASPPASVSIPIALGNLIGAVTFTGSMIAFAKLQELMSGRPFLFSGQQFVNALLGLGALALCVAIVLAPGDLRLFWGLLALAAVLGVLLVIPIGGADMPVVISLLNSYSGLAACATGFVFRNQVLIISGSLVGASGIILTQIMCKAMNRSLMNVLFSGFGQTVEAPGTASKARGAAKAGTAEDAAIVLDAAESVVVVPGYGMAVAQAQHAVKQLCDQLQKRGVDVKFAIHPVAGRMPGHMNVLLAEADVDYELLVEMDDINPHLTHTDVALVIGANDVTNPDARSNQGSPIYGMPIIDVDRCKTVMVIKRSLNPGFAGIDNPLYYLDQTMMLFGDAKSMVESLNRALKEL